LRPEDILTSLNRERNPFFQVYNGSRIEIFDLSHEAVIPEFAILQIWDFEMKSKFSEDNQIENLVSQVVNKILIIIML
jgi:hypothetical protein